MIEQQNTIIVIPARLASRRLPGKPLADIRGEPMIVHIWRRAMEAKIGHVLVAAADLPIADAVRAAGGDAIMTESFLPTAAARVAAALALRDPQARYSHIVNLEGAYPTIDPLSLQRCLAGLTNDSVEISTIAAPLMTAEPAADPAIVKVIAPLGLDREVAFVRDFQRDAGPDLPLWQHIDVYAYRRDALERLVRCPPSPREKDRNLDQMRALDNGMKVAVVRVDAMPLGVNAPAALEAARLALKEKK